MFNEGQYRIWGTELFSSKRYVGFLNEEEEKMTYLLLKSSSVCQALAGN
jgi:hypothetical protein